MTHPENPRPREIRVFPISETTVRASLKNIARNAKEAHFEGLTTLAEKQPALWMVVNNQAEKRVNPPNTDKANELSRGAAFLYTILTTHAARAGEPLPDITDSIPAADISHNQALTRFTENPDNSKKSFYEDAWEELTKEQEYQTVADGILNIVKYQSDKELFLLGAYITILPFIGRQRALDMERMMKD